MKRELERLELTPEPISGLRELPREGVGPVIGGPGGQTPRRRLLFGAALIGLLAMALGAAGWSVQKSDRVLSRSAVVRGELTEMGPRLSGMLLASDVQPGTRVKAGQVLGRLDDTHLRAKESEAIAQVEALERELALERAAIVQERATLDVRMQEIGAKALAAQAEVRAARLKMQDAQAYEMARKDLARDGIISTEALREASNRVSLSSEVLAVSASNGRAAESAYRNAQLERSGVALREQRLGVLQAQLTAAQARLAAVRADVAASRITAPADGTVVRWLINTGGSVEVGKPVLSFSLGDKRWVEAWIDEDEAARIRPGDVALVTMPFRSGQELRGQVMRLGVTTDGEPPSSGVHDPRPTRMRVAPVVPVEIALEAPPDSLLPGLSAAVTIQTPAR